MGEKIGKPTFVFAHGAWHGGWRWWEVMQLLAEQGRGSVPRASIRRTADRAIPIAAQDYRIAQADALTPGNRFAHKSPPTSHSLLVSAPADLATARVSLA
ncbi:hypothetical protein [Variovorax sp. E3]|uniref:hypothetical protein n=1 Tax=Variovorax sp. E3 TaxID=1914993 RepID=UPI0018DE295C|nr:hypothetical protein [Variovorax sp. E3]